MEFDLFHWIPLDAVGFRSMAMAGRFVMLLIYQLVDSGSQMPMEMVCNRTGIPLKSHWCNLKLEIALH